jgi:AcrR family transcriptional regulator
MSNPKSPFVQRRSPVQGRSRATVAAIRQAAAQVLAAEGFERATTNRIAEVAGVSIGTLYQYFSGRDALFDAVIDDVLDGVITAAGAAMTEAGPHDLPHRLRALTRATLGALAPYPAVLRQLDAAFGSSLRQRLQEARARGVELVTALLTPAVPQPAFTARIWVDMAEGLIFNLRPDDDLDALEQAVVHLFLSSLQPPRPGVQAQ